MAWTEFTRRRYESSGGRCGSDASDTEWALVAPLMPAPRKVGRWTLQIVNRPDTAQGFGVIPRRWVVERTLAWLGRCRRMAKDWENPIASAEAWLLIAHIRHVTRMLAGHDIMQKVSDLTLRHGGCRGATTCPGYDRRDG